MIDSCSLEVNETTLEFRLNYVMETIHEVYLDSLFLCEHLFGLSDFEFFCDISSPIFECFIKLTNTNVSHFNETSLKYFIGSGTFCTLNSILKLTRIVTSENVHMAKRTKVFDFGLSMKHETFPLHGSPIWLLRFH